MRARPDHLTTTAGGEPIVSRSTCDVEPVPGLPCVLRRGHSGIHYIGTIDIDAVYRRDRLS